MRDLKTEKHLTYLPFSRRPLVCLTLISVAFIFVMYFFMGIDLNGESILEKYAGKTVTVTGTVRAASEKDQDHHTLTVCTDTVKEGGSGYAENTCGERVLVSVYGDIVHPFHDITGRRVSFTALLERPSGKRNPGTFDYRLYLKTKKIYVTGNVEPWALDVNDEEILSFSDRFRNRISHLKYDFLDRIENDTSRGLISAVFFGDKSGLDEETYETFQKNGTAHILAVSGLHIGIIYAFICSIWRGRKRYLFSTVTSGFLLVYAALADFSPSVMRAVIMIILHMISKLVHRRYDMLTAASLSALIMLVFNPMQVFGSGFQLSYLAISILSVLIPVVTGKRGKYALPFLFQFAMLPFTAYMFNYVSLISFVINIPVIFLADLILPPGVILLGFTAAGAGQGVVCDFLSFLLDSGADILVRLNESTCVQGVTTFNAVSPGIFFTAFFYGLFFLILSEFFRVYFVRHMKRELIRCFAAILILSVISYVNSDSSFKRCDLVFVDVGQGDCIHLRTGSSGDYIFDGGGKVNYNLGEKTLKPYLLKNGAGDIDAAFVSHNHTDHFEGIRQLSEGYRVKKVFFSKSYSEIHEELERSVKADETGYLDCTNEVRLGKECFVKILWPLEGTSMGDPDDENANSMIMKIICDGVSVLVTGDIDSECERKLTEHYRGTDELRCDILKVAHHGSKYSSSDEFLEEVNPSVAVIQVGKNTYGHPSSEALERLKKRGIKVYRNDLNGAVGFETADGEIRKVRLMNDEDN